MKSKRSMVLLLIVVCLCLCSCGEHKHKWTDNGCESYKVCKDCGEQGEYVEHSFNGEIGCEKELICTKCNQIIYYMHTPDASGICTKCNKNVGITLTDDNVEKYIELKVSGQSLLPEVKSRSNSYSFENVRLKVLGYYNNGPLVVEEGVYIVKINGTNIDCKNYADKLRPYYDTYKIKVLDDTSIVHIN